MKCPKCGSENPAKNRFCGECGYNFKSASEVDRIKLVRKDIPESLVKKILSTKDTLEKERRDVTVVFADISGFTTMAELLDPEELTHLMNECFRKLSMMVYRYEGMIDKFIGDCIMAIFGAPVSHEDDPERAILACLDMQTAISDMNAQFDEKSKRLDLHSGINTGVVIAGKVGSDLQMDYTVMGDTVNVAQRLKDIARPGTTLVGPETYKRSRHAFDFAAQPEIQLKGKVESIKPYQILGRKWGTEFGSAVIHSDLVGREAELDKLKEGYADLINHRTSIFLIKGDIGVGKSRLMYEFKKFLALTNPDLAMLDSRGVSYDSSIPYKAFVDSLQHYILKDQSGWTDESTRLIRDKLVAMLADEAAEIVPYLFRLMNIELDENEQEKVRHLDSHSLQLQISLAVAALIEKISSERPIFFFIDDIQWLDTASLELLNFLLPMIKRANINYCLSFRSGELVATKKVLDNIKLELGMFTREICLANLTTEQSVTLVDNLLGQSIDPVIRQYIIEKSLGNPFFIEEMVRHIIESGLLTSKEEVIVERLHLPGSIEAAVTSRIDRLNQEARYLLKIASIIGRTFPRALLEEVVKERDILNHIEQLEAAEFLIRTNKDHEVFFSFRHPIFQEVAYHSLLKSERTVYHKIIAETIEGKFAGKFEGQAAILADHYYNCRNYPKALEYLLVAGDEAAKLFANDEALTHYQLALSISEDERLRAEILEKVGDINFLVGAIPKASENFQEARGRSKDKIVQARLSVKIAETYIQTGRIDEGVAMMNVTLKTIENDNNQVVASLYYKLADNLLEIKAQPLDAIPFIDKGIAIAKQLGDPRLEADGLKIKCHLLWRCGGNEEALRILPRCQSLYELSNTPQGLVSLFLLTGAVYRSIGRIGTAIDFAQKAVAIGQQIGTPRGVAIAYNNLGIYYDIMGDPDTAIDYYMKTLALRQKLVDKRGEAITYFNIGVLKSRVGELDAALDYYKKAQELMERINDVRGAFNVYHDTATVLLLKGEKEQARQYYEKAQKIAEEKQDRTMLSEMKCRYGSYFINLGEYDQALKVLMEAEELMKGEEDKQKQVDLLQSLAEAYISLNDNRALSCAGQALEMTRAAAMKWEEVIGLRILGRAQAMTPGKFSEGIRNIEQSIEMAEAMKYVSDIGHGLMALGGVYLAEGKSGQAREYLTRARKIYSDINARLMLEKTEYLLKGIEPVTT